MATYKTAAKGVGAGAGVSAIALAISLIAPWEGKRNDPYIDIVGIPTVCYGETRVPMKRYSDTECEDMLRKAAEGFQREVLNCTPVLANRPYQLAAATSLAYNIGATTYCKSSIAKKFNARDFKGGCQSFPLYKYAGGKVSKGLENRRNMEMKLCLTNLPST